MVDACGSDSDQNETVRMEILSSTWHPLAKQSVPSPIGQRAPGFSDRRGKIPPPHNSSCDKETSGERLGFHCLPMSAAETAQEEELFRDNSCHPDRCYRQEVEEECWNRSIEHTTDHGTVGSLTRDVSTFSTMTDVNADNKQHNVHTRMYGLILRYSAQR